eukprot:scaffold49693_cov58-Attheya_sp.AAC.1
MDDGRWTMDVPSITGPVFQVAALPERIIGWCHPCWLRLLPEGRGWCEGMLQALGWVVVVPGTGTGTGSLLVPWLPVSTTRCEQRPPSEFRLVVANFIWRRRWRILSRFLLSPSLGSPDMSSVYFTMVGGWVDAMRCDQRVLVLVLVGVDRFSGRAVSLTLSFQRVPLGASVCLLSLPLSHDVSRCVRDGF